MEDDIKILEYYNKINCKEKISEQDLKLIISQIYSVMSNFEDKLCDEMQEKVAELKEFIENLINRNKELEEENKILEVNGFRQGLYEKDCGYIPKSKVRDMIEELKYIGSELCKRIFDNKKTTWTEVIQDVLQELLQEEEE